MIDALGTPHDTTLKRSESLTSSFITCFLFSTKRIN